SARARRVRLVLSPADGLVVVVPRGYALHRVPQVVAQHAGWIQRARRRLEEEARRAGGSGNAPSEPAPGLPAAPPSPPAWVWLRALGEVWLVGGAPGPEPAVPSRRPPAAGPAAGGPVTPPSPPAAPTPPAGAGTPGFWPAGPAAAALPQEVPVAGRITLPAGALERGPAAWAPPLRAWLARRARATLLPWLEALARERGFRLAGSSVGCPKTRWGSCSATRHIRLSLKLLFLPPELVEHVLIHELCHTVHLHHGPAFWALVARHDPRAAENRRHLRAAWSYVPAWLRPARSIGPSVADGEVPLP
ncbi:MAG TPA: M48 family metallopeptidase, partial [Thermaerobacter sp.]